MSMAVIIGVSVAAGALLATVIFMFVLRDMNIEYAEEVSFLCNKMEMLEKSNDELYEDYIEALKTRRDGAIREFARRLKVKYSQADILCPRRVISLTEKELYEFVEEMTETENE